MKNCIGIINSISTTHDYGGLCSHRPVYMLPFGGRYRLVDIPISIMVNHGIRTVAIYTGDKIRSTMDHLGNGKPWDLNRRFNGLFLFPPAEVDYKRGDLAQYHSTEEFFNRSSEDYVFITHPHILAKVDLIAMFNQFVASNADIGLLYKKVADPHGNLINAPKMNIDREGRLLNIGINLGTESTFNLYLRMAFVKKEVLMELVKMSLEKADLHTLLDAILDHRDRYNIQTYEHKGHIENIKDVKSYYDANLNLFKYDISQELFFEKGQIYTKTKDEPSTLYKENAKVQNSIVANGCIIEGTVENSVIFRGVKIGAGAVVKNSIVMQKTTIEDDAVVVNSILDKYVYIHKGANIVGNKAIPFVVEKNRSIRKENTI